MIAELEVRSGSKEEVFEWMNFQNIEIKGTSSKIKMSIFEQNHPLGTAFVVGNEKHGLGSFWKKNLTQWCSIPTLGTASSLNLNASVACLLSEFNRRNRRV